MNRGPVGRVMQECVGIFDSRLSIGVGSLRCTQRVNVGVNDHVVGQRAREGFGQVRLAKASARPDFAVPLRRGTWIDRLGLNDNSIENMFWRAGKWAEASPRGIAGSC